jgi:hypothetical protein
MDAYPACLLLLGPLRKFTEILEVTAKDIQTENQEMYLIATFNSEPEGSRNPFASSPSELRNWVYNY